MWAKPGDASNPSSAGQWTRLQPPRSGKDLKALAATYAAQWLELECAIGREAAEEARRAVEALAADRESQLRLSFAEATSWEPQENGHAES